MNAVAPLDIIEVQEFNSESECKGNLYLCIFLIYHNNKVKLQEEYYKYTSQVMSLEATSNISQAI